MVVFLDDTMHSFWYRSARSTRQTGRYLSFEVASAGFHAVSTNFIWQSPTPIIATISKLPNIDHSTSQPNIYKYYPEKIGNLQAWYMMFYSFFLQ